MSQLNLFYELYHPNQPQNQLLKDKSLSKTDIYPVDFLTQSIAGVEKFIQNLSKEELELFVHINRKQQK